MTELLEAASASPRIARLAAELEAAGAHLLAAKTYPYNPELVLEAADRSGAGDSTTDRGLALVQRFELGGQRGERRAAAEADLDGARGAIVRARRLALADAAGTFALTVFERERLAIERADAELARSFAELVERRLEAGAATALDLALAQAGLARAQGSLAAAQGAYLAAQARLAEAAGGVETEVAPIEPTPIEPVLVEAMLIEPKGELPPLTAPPPLQETLDLAFAGRGDLRAARSAIEAAAERVRLARSGRVPDLTVSARVGREEGDDLAGINLGLPLPLFDRNQGQIARAAAELSIARADLAARELVVRREVTAAHVRFEAALEAHRSAERLGVTSLEDGLGLVERSFEAGRIGAAELLLFRRELVEGRRQAVAADAEVWSAALELVAAVGAGLPGWEWLDVERRKP